MMMMMGEAIGIRVAITSPSGYVTAHACIITAILVFRLPVQSFTFSDGTIDGFDAVNRLGSSQLNFVSRRSSS